MSHTCDICPYTVWSVFLALQMFLIGVWDKYMKMAENIDGFSATLLPYILSMGEILKECVTGHCLLLEV